jgi:transposase InsO family protein
MAADVLHRAATGFADRLMRYVPKCSASRPGLRPGPGVSAWIQDYNTQRRHSALGMMSPVSYERALRDGEAA